MPDLKKSFTIKVLEHTTAVTKLDDDHVKTDLKTNEIFTQQFESVDVGALARFLNKPEEKKEKDKK